MPNDFRRQHPACLNIARLCVMLPRQVHHWPGGKHTKTCFPATPITVHGIELDTVKWEARLPPDKVQKLLSSFAAYGNVVMLFYTNSNMS